jgi:hypothetical protein
MNFVMLSYNTAPLNWGCGGGGPADADVAFL